MKRLIFLWILLNAVCIVFSQEVQFPPSIINAGGKGINSNSNQISRWRIGYINVIQINNNLKSAQQETTFGKTGVDNEDWSILSYPNPTSDYLNLQFSINEKKLIGIRLSDVAGQKLLERKVENILPGEIITLDMRRYAPAIYLIYVWSENNDIDSIIKISKK